MLIAYLVSKEMWGAKLEMFILGPLTLSPDPMRGGYPKLNGGKGGQLMST